MATGATTGYAAGEQTNTSPVDYAQEVTYNIAPAGTYQRLRLTGESLAAQDSTSTPDEINNLPEVAETVLTGRSTGGSVNGVLSYGTYDDFLAGVLGADFTSLAAITPSPGKFTVQQVDPGNGKGCPPSGQVMQERRCQFLAACRLGHMSAYWTRPTISICMQLLSVKMPVPPSFSRRGHCLPLDQSAPRPPCRLSTTG
ncbi:phage tail tube protein [Acetobacter senegalensis]|uniref:phage tail tube protein n=1 Tax=Acetobacter senegalensis TaxID=446692 RepID=UPI000A5B5599|nr:phage tail tube protein [Acetobacter senegalensis]